MKRHIAIYLGLLAGLLSACFRTPPETGQSTTAQEQKPVTEKSANFGKPLVEAAKAYASFSAFWPYYSEYIHMNLDFYALDTAGKEIPRGQFLEQIKTGKYGPLIVYGDGTQPYYRLYQLPKDADQTIVAYMRQFGDEFLQLYSLENKPLPDFNFTDINGNNYTAANTKGKIILIKCWFIGCTACVKEMPALNELVNNYKDRKDILYLSLAIDGKNELQNFLKKTQFDYATIGNKGDYMSRKLHVVGYPTHFIVNREGNVVHALKDVYEVKQALEKELAKQ